MTTKQDVINKMKTTKLQISVLGRQDELASYFDLDVPEEEPLSLFYSRMEGKFRWGKEPLTWMEDYDSTDFLELEDA